MDVHKRLDAIINLFRCLHGRDVFIKQYSKDLGARLLNKSSTSSEYEELFIQKLQVECGANQVNSMKQMFKDMSLSHETQEEFSRHLAAQNNPLQGIEFQCEILTNGTWPQMEQPPCQLPQLLANCTDRFTLWFK
jgi:cullin 3